MVFATKPRITAEEFEAFDQLPENAEKKLELIGGEIVEVPSNPYASEIASLINWALVSYIKQNPIGRVTGEQGGYMVSGERYAPDVAFISKARQPELVRKGYYPQPPDLAVEVISSPEEEKHLPVKIGNYLAAGTQVWVVFPESQTVQVYAPAQPVKILTITDTLDAPTLLPKFALAVKDIFPTSG